VSNGNSDKKTVVVLGASAKPERYSYQCVELLLERGHRVIPVTPSQTEICGLSPVCDLESVDEKIDVLTMYVNAKRSSDMVDSILDLNPRKVIFNPGAENPDLEKKCTDAGIAVENACTLVLIYTDQFN
jgi:predicted CoA-binding protein